MIPSRKLSIPAKLIGLTAVVAGVVLSAREYRENVHVAELPSDPMAVYPVDRNDLSQLVLPAEAVDSNLILPMPKRLETNASSTISITTEAGTKGNSVRLTKAAQLAKLAHSAYELKLEDQQAWGSFQRQVDLMPKESQPPAPAAGFEIASSDLPLVPGIEDPHRWYGESSSGNLASSFNPLSTPLIAPSKADDSIIPIELTKGSFDFSAPITTALLPPLQKVKSVLNETVELAPVVKTVAESNGAQAMRTARAWETGRY